MSSKQFAILAAAAVILAVLALVVANVESGRHEAAPQTRLYPDLEAKLNDIARVAVQRAGNAPVNIEREGDRWKVVEKGGYRADLERLRDGLINLARAELIEAKTQNPENYVKLGVQAIDKAQADTQEIKLWTEQGGDPLVHLLIGKTGTAGGSYVRKAEDAQSWLASQRLSFPAEAEDWLDKDLINIENQRIARIEVRRGEADGYVLFKSAPKATSFELESVPQAKQVKAHEVRRLSSALGNLQLDDVLAAGQSPDAEGAWHQAVFKTFDGLLIKAQSRETDNKHYLKLAAHFDPELVKTDEGAPAAKTDDASTEAAPTIANAKAEAERLQQQLNGWTFVIPAYKATALQLSRDELLEDEEKSNEDKKDG